MRISGGTGEVREGCRGWRLTSDRVIELARLVASCAVRGGRLDAEKRKYSSCLQLGVERRLDVQILG